MVIGYARILLNGFAVSLAELLRPIQADRLIVERDRINRRAGHALQRGDHISGGGVSLAGNGRAVLRSDSKQLVLVAVVLDHFLVKLVHGAVPLGNGSSRRRGGCCRLDFLNISTVRVNADRLGSHVKGYTEIDGLANVAQLDIVVALDFVGCHADFLAVHSDTLVGRLGGRAGYGGICDASQLRCSARSADLDSARVLVPVYAKACQLANIAQLEIVVVVDVVSGRVHTGRANINSLSLSSGRHNG